MLLSRAPLMLFADALRNMGFSFCYGWRVLDPRMYLRPISVPSTEVTCTPHAGYSELVIPLPITVGTSPPDVLRLSTAFPGSRPRALVTPGRRAKVHQVLVEPISYIRLRVTITARPLVRVLLKSYALPNIARLSLSPAGLLYLAPSSNSCFHRCRAGWV